MKNILRNLLPLAILLPVIIACNAAKEIEKGIKEIAEPKIIGSDDGSCQVTVPALWSEEKGLHEDASLGAHNALSDAYIMVIKDVKSDFKKGFTVDDYAKLLRDDLPSRMEENEMSPVTTTQINGFEAREFETSGLAEGLKIKYLYALVSTPDAFYQVISWTTPSRFDKNRTEMTEALHSFKLVSSGSSPSNNLDRKKAGGGLDKKN